MYMSPGPVLKVKGPMPLDEKTNVVYRIPYGSVYVAQTNQSLMIGVKEHQRAAFTKNKDTSALAEHVVETEHTRGWKGT